MNAPAVGLAFSPDGGRVAVTTGPDVAVVDVATGAVQGFADGTRCCADQLLFVDGGQKLVTSRYAYDVVGTGSPAITLLDLATGDLTTLFAVGDIYGSMGLALSSDGATLLASRGSELHAWDTVTWSPKTVASGFPVRSVMAIDATGTYVGVSNDYVADGTHLQVRRLADGVLVRDLLLQPGLTVDAWSLNRMVLTATAPDGSGATRLGVVDTTGRTLARACSPAAGYPYLFATAAPRLLARAGNGLRVYDARSGDPVGPLLDPGITTWLGFSPDGDWIAWASSLVPSVGAQVTLANALTGEQRPIGEPAEAYFAAFPSSGGQLVAVMDTQTGLTNILDATSQATVAQFDRPSAAVFPTGFSADGSALIFSDDAGNQQAVDWRTGTPQPLSSPTVQSLPAAAQAFMRDSNGCVSGLNPYASFSSDGRLAAVGLECGREFASGTMSDTELYDVASGTLIQAVPNPSTIGPLLSADGAILAFDAALWCRQ
jgi:DNA-binding beta-propeller fold protein YncE